MDTSLHHETGHHNFKMKHFGTDANSTFRKNWSAYRRCFIRNCVFFFFLGMLYTTMRITRMSSVKNSFTGNSIKEENKNTNTQISIVHHFYHFFPFAPLQSSDSNFNLVFLLTFFFCHTFNIQYCTQWKRSEKKILNSFKMLKAVSNCYLKTRRWRKKKN